MKLFWLKRSKDISGVSGVGIVCEGVQFHDGQCVISWFGQLHSINVYPDVETLVRIHGHEGTTEVVWGKEDDTESEAIH